MENEGILRNGPEEYIRGIPGEDSQTRQEAAVKGIEDALFDVLAAEIEEIALGKTGQESKQGNWPVPAIKRTQMENNKAIMNKKKQEEQKIVWPTAPRIDSNKPRPINGQKMKRGNSRQKKRQKNRKSKK